MACIRIRGTPQVGVSSGRYFFSVAGGRFDECIPEGGGTILCYTCSSRCGTRAAPEDRLLAGPPRLDASLWSHYSRLVRGTLLEPIVRLAALLAGTSALEKLVDALVSSWLRGRGDERRVIAAMLWPLPCRGETLENLTGILERLQPRGRES